MVFNPVSLPDSALFLNPTFSDVQDDTLTIKVLADTESFRHIDRKDEQHILVAMHNKPEIL